MPANHSLLGLFMSAGRKAFKLPNLITSFQRSNVGECRDFDGDANTDEVWLDACKILVRMFSDTGVHDWRCWVCAQ